MRKFIFSLTDMTDFTLTSSPIRSISASDHYEFGALIDLHLHLDGSISIESAKELARLQGMPVLCDEELKERMSAGSDCHSLNDFLTKFDYACSLLQTREGITRAVRNLIHELKQQGLIYAEIRFAPQKSMEGGLTMREVVEAAIGGLDDEVMPARLILCCMRGKDEEVNDLNIATIEMAKEFLGKGVVAADLAGAEALFPTSDHADVFALARNLGVPFTIHAGEAEGAMTASESMQAAIDMGASRLGHGILSYRDPEMFRQLADKQIGLGICPTSNICTEAFKDIKDYPYPTLLQHNVKFCICTDDMTVADVTLRDEYELIRSTFGMSKQTACQLLLNAADMSFATENIKQRLRKQVLDYYKS